MPSSRKKKAQQIHRTLQQKSNQNQVVTPQQFTQTMLEHNATTVEQDYIDILKSLDLIHDHKNGYKVSEPQTPDTNPNTTEKASARVEIRKDLNEAVEELPVTKDELLEHAIERELNALKDRYGDIIDIEATEKEIDYIQKLKHREIHTINGTKEERARELKERRDLFEKMFDKDPVKPENNQRIETLRKEAYKLQKDTDSL
jgi:hypothetical protein